jgi:flavin reductase (DIM6/NTAB) family NADH-FMN oxidoreductase RutF
MDLRPNDLSPREFYRILIASVAPRPIAWVSTISAHGHLNLAPFSFFNVISDTPPLLGFSPAPRPANSTTAEKDTLSNIRETGEFVVNTVTFALAEAMNLTSGEYDASINEFEVAGVTPLPSQLVRPPHVAESPVSFECKLYQVLDFGLAGQTPTGHLVLGEIVSVHINESVLQSDGRVDGNALDLIARMGGMQYSRTRPDDRFELSRPVKELPKRS